MISNKTVNHRVDTPSIPFILKILKTTNGLVVPILTLLAVICAILCCFKSAEGSNSRMIAFAILIVSVIIIVLVKTLNGCMEKSFAYRCYQAKIVRILEPDLMVPLCTIGFIIVLPLYVLFVQAIKTPAEANQIVFSWWPTKGIDLESFKQLFSYSDTIGVSIGRAMLNSFVYAIIPVTASIFASSLAAYVFAKLEFPGKKTMYHLLIMTMMMPGCVTMSTSYIMYDWYGWTNSPLPLIIPGFFGGAGTVMFIREFFMGIPNGLLEAAKIDGAGKWKIFFTVVLPLGKPALTAQFVLGFIGNYNTFLGPLIYLNKPQQYSIQIALDFFNGALADNTMIATAGMLTLVPMLTLYVIFQKRILSGISISSGLKG